jgi:hypothetical protein
MSKDGTKVSCHLSSEKCELKFEFNEIGNVNDTINVIDDRCIYPCIDCPDGKCNECDNYIEGIILNKDLQPKEFLMNHILLQLVLNF